MVLILQSVDSHVSNVTGRDEGDVCLGAILILTNGFEKFAKPRQILINAEIPKELPVSCHSSSLSKKTA